MSAELAVCIQNILILKRFCNEYFCLFVLMLLHPCQQFFSRVLTFSCLPGLNQNKQRTKFLTQRHTTAPMVSLKLETLQSQVSDFIWDFRKLPYPSHLGKYFIKIGKISAKKQDIEKIKAIFGLGMTPI